MEAEQQQQSLYIDPNLRPVGKFDQAKHGCNKQGGNLSPLRSSTKWDAVHNEAIVDYGMRSSHHSQMSSTMRQSSRRKSGSRLMSRGQSSGRGHGH